MRLLIIEDEKDILLALQKGLQKEGYAVDVTGDGEEALELLNFNTYNLVVLDINLPSIDGFSILEILREKDMTTRVIIVSANREIEDKIRGLDLSLIHIFFKPWQVFLKILTL